MKEFSDERARREREHTEQMNEMETKVMDLQQGCLIFRELFPYNIRQHFNFARRLQNLLFLRTFENLIFLTFLQSYQHHGLARRIHGDNAERV